MILGPDYIYKCPTCGKLLRHRSFASGNTFRARLFSDGKNSAPMLPNFPFFVKCKNCNSFFKFSELKEVGVAEFNHRTGYDAIKWESIFWEMKYFAIDREKIPYSEPLDTSDLYEALEKFPQYELGFRQQIWWSYNNYLRDFLEYDQPIRETHIQFMERNELFEENCFALLKLLDVNNENQKIMMAELYRNVGQFEKCMELIESLPVHFERIKGRDRSYNLKSIYKTECAKKNKYLFRIDNYPCRYSQNPYDPK